MSVENMESGVELRGIGKVTNFTGLRAGGFYRRLDYDGGTILMQAVTDKDADSEQLFALEFRSEAQGGVRLEEIYRHAIFASVPAVHLRVDSATMAGDHLSSNLRAQMLVISGNVPILLATPARNFGYVFIDLGNGAVAQTRPTEWASFNRWSLVMDDGDEEVELVSFGASTAT